MKRRTSLLVCLFLGLGVTFAADPAAKNKHKKYKLHYTFCNLEKHPVTVELVALGFDQHDSSQTYTNVVPAGKTLSFVAKVVDGPSFDFTVDVFDNGSEVANDMFLIMSPGGIGWIDPTSEKLVMSYKSGELHSALGPL
ncbi:MAG: hypothetical protein U0903_12230 [Planctomycetales bacterium]